MTEDQEVNDYSESEPRNVFADDVVVDSVERPPAGTAAEPPPLLPIVTRETLEEKSPRRQGLLAALLYALSAMALGYPALFGRFLAGENSDQFVAGYAFREYGAAMLKATGGFAQWNPFLFGGMPYIAAMHGDI